MTTNIAKHTPSIIHSLLDSGIFVIRGWLWLLFLGPMVVLGQDFDHYQRLKATGQMPVDFVRSAEEKYQEKVQAIPIAERKNIRQAKAQFFEESTYYLNQLLMSGKILFNDEVSTYVNEIAQYILRDEPLLRDQLRFYVVRSPSANAFATNDGMVFINTGLLAQLENEAQLAFILCHEVSHFIKHHPLAIFLQTTLENKNGVNNGREVEASILDKNNYTKEKEQEADQLGLDLYLPTEYDLTAVLSAFDVLKYAHLPFANLPFDPAIFETNYLKIPSEYLLKNLDEIEDAYRNIDESESTHPSPDTRKSLIYRKLFSYDNEGRQESILGKERFLHARERCRFENCHLMLLNFNYEAAIYNAYLLLHSHSNSFYLQKIIAQGLYGLSRHADEGKLWDVHTDFSAIQGNAQQLYHLIEHLEDHELNVVALAYNWRLYQAHPEDEELELMIKDLMLALGKNYVGGIDYFEKMPPGDKIGIDESFVKYGLVEELRNKVFEQWLTEHIVMGQSILLENQAVIPQKEKKRAQRKLSLKGFHLGLDRIVFVDPYYKRIDQRKQPSVQFLTSEMTKSRMMERIALDAQKLDLEQITLSPTALKTDGSVLYNELSLLQEWISAQAEGVEMVSINHTEVQALKEKYGTPYFVWMGVVSLSAPKTPKERRFAKVFGGPFPFTLYPAYTARHDTYFYTMVYDLEAGDYLILYPKYLRMKDREDVLNSAIYDLLLQLKSQEP